MIPLFNTEITDIQLNDIEDEQHITAFIDLLNFNKTITILTLEDFLDVDQMLLQIDWEESSITQLILHFCTFKQDFKELCQKWAKSRLKKLFIVGCSIDDDFVQEVQPLLKNQLVELVIPSNNVTASGLETISTCAGKNKEFSSLNISNNHIEKGWRFFNNFSFITDLKIGNLKIDEEFGYFLEALGSFNLQELSIYQTQFTLDQFLGLTNAIAKLPLGKLCLDDCDLGVEHAEMIASMCQNTIVELDLSRNNLADDGTAIIAKALRKNRFVSLDLSDNHVGSEGMKSIADLLIYNRLERLVLNSNSICTNSAYQLVRGLKSNTSLLELHLENCTYQSNSSEILLCSLESHHYLSSLFIYQEEFRTIPFTQVSNMLQKNKSLRYISCAYGECDLLITNYFLNWIGEASIEYDEVSRRYANEFLYTKPITMRNIRLQNNRTAELLVTCRSIGLLGLPTELHRQILILLIHYARIPYRDVNLVCRALMNSDMIGITTSRALLLVGAIVITSVVVWITAVITYQHYVYSSVSLLVVAYTLGLRHALDADHIAAIDNVTRRLIQSKQKPVTVGFFFSLGHSTIVIIATGLIAICSTAIADRYDQYNTVSSTIGSSISASFLIIIGIINAITVYAIIKNMKQLQEKELDWDMILNEGGLFCRIFGLKFFKSIDKPWKMYFVGFLFGLGFDTATEIGLLAIATIQSVSGVSAWLTMFLPMLFTCGMTLLDSLDGIAMLGVYRWAMISPQKKLFYNLFITTVSFLFALMVAVIEILGIIQSNYNLDGAFWDGVASIGDDAFGYIGLGFLVTFLLGWAFAAFIYHKYKKAPTEKLVDSTNEAENHLVIISKGSDHEE
ncbi:hypothetical protein HDV06_003772 [Boothiomyces sp. JEL0866]|nr:hypothetical protein HDV06_003772 [Boothiomyces sp. JEL0866]